MIVRRTNPVVCSPQAVTKALKETIDDIQKDIGKRMYESCLQGRIPEGADLLSKDDMVRLKR